MAEAILDLRLDTVQPNRVRLVYGVQNDYNSRYICARFTANGKPIDIEKTAAVRINAKRPDGNKDAFPGTVNTDGTAKVPVAQWMLDVPGEVIASITAVTTGGALTTQEFYIMAKASIWDSTGEPSAENPDKDVLQTIIASENERVAAESTRVANENARKSAETARATAETKRIADEATRVVNEAGRVSAEEIRREEFATWQDEWGKISSFDKRIENLEAAVSPGLVTPTVDSTVAYSKTVPKGVLPNAAVCEVGGMSYRCENLIPFPYGDTTVTRNGITWTVNADGSVTANGTATSDSYFNLKKYSYDDFIKLNVGEACTLSGYPSSGLGKGYIIIQDISYKQDALTEGTATTFTPKYNSYYMQIKILSGKTVSNLVIRPMLNKGTTALPYQPYFTGLRDSKVTAVESVGVNCIPFPYSFSAGTYNGVKLTINSDGTVALNGTATGASYLLLRTATLPAGTYYVSDSGENDWESRFYVGHSENYFKNSSFTLTEPTLVEFRIAIYESFSGTATLKPMVNRGTEALPYSTYFRATLPIPGDALDGWGQGVNAQFYNKIVLDPADGVMKYRQICAKRGYLAGDETRVDVLTDGKNETVYILENPVETDVSHLFTDDNLLPVEAGGTITAVNEYEQAVPFTIEYTVKGA